MMSWGSRKNGPSSLIWVRWHLRDAILVSTWADTSTVVVTLVVGSAQGVYGVHGEGRLDAAVEHLLPPALEHAAREADVVEQGGEAIGVGGALHGGGGVGRTWSCGRGVRSRRWGSWVSTTWALTSVMALASRSMTWSSSALQ